jgi:hypothetical protein
MVAERAIVVVVDWSQWMVVLVVVVVVLMVPWKW